MAPKKKTTPVKERTSLYIQPELFQNMKYVIYKDEVTQTDIVNEALTEYFAKWEKKNGPIPKK
jgi:hypothetical protein